jgi:hypothetical protein
MCQQLIPPPWEFWELQTLGDLVIETSLPDLGDEDLGAVVSNGKIKHGGSKWESPT